jgi:serine/threonine-protein kinase
MTAPVQPGDVLLDKYRVERVLGQGGMGVVVAARHVELGELFAIKLLLPQGMRYPGAAPRFVREARASARLKGEHVAKVHDVGRLPDGLPYMVLEYLAGKDLKETLGERGPLPVDEAVTYFLQACEAVGEAHEHGIVHRDLKPANLFLARRHDGIPTVKVLDFGISRQLEPEDPEEHGLTKTGMVLGTPNYMSPEQMTRGKEVDPRSDIWSLGCVLYELLTGHVPFRADMITELVGKVLQEQPAPLGAYRSDIPPIVEATVMRCLAKRPEHRFQSIHELAEALRGAALPTGTLVLAASTEGLPAASIGAASPNTGSATGSSTTRGWGKTASAAGANASPARRTSAIAVAVVAFAGLLAGGAWLTLRTRPPAPSQSTVEATQAPAAPSIAAEVTSSPEAASVAEPPPAPSAEPASVETAPRAPPPPRLPPKSRPVGRRDGGSSVATTSALPSAKPSAEPTAAPPATKHNTMY